MEWSDGLALAAKKFCEQTKDSDTQETEGTNKFMAVLKEFGTTKESEHNHYMGDTAGFGAGKGRSIVTSMLVDNGLDGLKERQNLFNRKYT